VTQQEHEQLVQEEADGQILFGIDRAFARRFFTDVPLSAIQRETGEATYFEKLVVFGAFLAAPVSLLVSAVFAVQYFRWWSILVVPASVALWFLFSGTSSMARSPLRIVSLVLIAAIAAVIFGTFDARLSRFLLCVALAFWLNRFMYIAATVFLRALIIRSHQAFSFLHEHITIKRAEPGDGVNGGPPYAPPLR
jgi:hypothetical protein